jgi:hypothetical protein
MKLFVVLALAIVMAGCVVPKQHAAPGPSVAPAPASPPPPPPAGPTTVDVTFYNDYDSRVKFSVATFNSNDEKLGGRVADVEAGWGTYVESTVRCDGSMVSFGGMLYDRRGEAMDFRSIDAPCGSEIHARATSAGELKLIVY